ncbi:hypothetical protein C9374_008833 [Naegleria lovaniensis]|uniref:Nicotinamide-nucleotide adenylyltransferase n=1 Tax=Naegleria lovaniensis TaxID=51637 RepID=A0AA88GF57_NAELO|nr:uncharacterized protein C9374_013038 [Naegleria lovaniensis]XP_044545010.1 uncharacterized protein C9374_008833 [Naegleria lovaniensis]KAG2372916.1 hypothetical protein C9374_013038 [Naegleria lovaniensis]KAG2377748.1 hypothetical protein C9374_008833 [Naegleria lovaniensis]
MSQHAYLFPSHKLQALPTTANNNGSIILIACGSFNPITNSHLRMFETARDYLQNEEKLSVLGGFISPVHQDYAKRKPTLIEAHHRVEMCKLAVSDSDWVDIDLWEVNQNEYSRTLFVLKHFTEEIEKLYSPESCLQHQVRIMLLCGADLLESFVKPGVWIPEQVEYILSTYGVCCIERDGISISKIIFEHDVLYKHRKNIHVIPEWIINDVSSTKVRQLVRRNHSIKYYVADKVAEYIKNHQLYLAEQTSTNSTNSHAVVFENKQL